MKLLVVVLQLNSLFSCLISRFRLMLLRQLIRIGCERKLVMNLVWVRLVMMENSLIMIVMIIDRFIRCCGLFVVSGVMVVVIIVVVVVLGFIINCCELLIRVQISIGRMYVQRFIWGGKLVIWVQVMVVGIWIVVIDSLVWIFGWNQVWWQWSRLLSLGIQWVSGMWLIFCRCGCCSLV